MNEYLLSLIEADLKNQREIEARLESRKNELSEFEGCCFKVDNKHCGTYYSYKKKGDTHYIYLGKDHPIVQSIQDYHYCCTGLEIVRQNIAAAEDYLARYTPIDDATIRSALPLKFQGTSRIPMLEVDEIVEAWLAEKKRFKDEHPSKYQDNYRVTGCDGTLMRSRAESIIYNIFVAENIPCIYEYPWVQEDGALVYPDFTLLNRRALEDEQTRNRLIRQHQKKLEQEGHTGELTKEDLLQDLSWLRELEYIWEHLGLWFTGDPNDRQRYRQEFEYKTDQYLEMKFVPDQNLIFTFEGGPLGFNSAYIHKKVKDTFTTA